MKILGIVGSPRKEKGRTDALVWKALDGARSVGAQTDVMYLMDRNPIIAQRNIKKQQKL